MANSLDVVVKFVGDATSAVKAANDTEAAYTKMGNKVAGVGKTLSLAVSLPLAAAGVAAFKEMEQAGKVAAQTDAAIKSTGGVANVTAKQIDTLAQSLLNKSGIDDEAIKSGENLLLTFTNIHNEAGKGNDIFNQATKAALDMSVAFGKDVPDAALILGKALNNPLDGLGKLQKIGVQFTDQQKEQIKTMVAAGDTMGAQKVILAELHKEVGGSVEAYGNTLAGQVSRARESLLNAGASIVAVAAPALELLAAGALKAANFLQGLPAPIQLAIGGFAIFAAALGPVLTIVGNLIKLIGPIRSFFQTMQVYALYAAEALATLSVAEIAVIAGAALVAVGIGFLVYQLFNQKSAAEQAADAGKKWATQQVENANASHDATLALADLVPTFKAVNAALADAQGEYDRLAKVQAEQRSQTAGVNAAWSETTARMTDLGVTIANLKAKHDVLGPAIAEARKELELQKIAAEQQAEANDRLADTGRGVAAANNATAQSITGIANVYLAAEGGPLAYEAAQLRVESATAAVTEANDKYGAGSLQARQASNDLAQAQLAVAGAAYQQEQNQGTLSNLLKTGGVSALQSYRDTLAQAESKTHDATGATQGQIEKVDALIRFLGGVPHDTTAAVHADTETATWEMQAFGREADEATRPRTAYVTPSFTGWGNVPAWLHPPEMMAGGLVPGSPTTPFPAILHGGEMVIPSSQVRSMASGSGAVVGGSVFNVNVSVASGTSPAVVGAAVVDQIRAYERVAGRAWRTT